MMTPDDARADANGSQQNGKAVPGPDDVMVHVPCARGTETCVLHELRALGATTAKAGRAVVHATGPLALVPKANIGLRCGSRVLLEIGRFVNVVTEDDMVQALLAFPFEERLDGKGTFAVEAHLSNCAWTHEHFAALRTKDCILDRLRDLGRGRPDVDTQYPSLRYVLFWEGTAATLSLDTTGEALHQRGYRRGVTGRAPMRETLAAAILALGHAPVDRPFLDPCCGTGTLAIEQALRALKWAPGRDRKFAFERWRDRPPALDRGLALARDEARAQELTALPAPIHLSDWHHEALEHATQCVEQAGLSRHVVLERIDARRAGWLGPRTVVCTNLPFGERLGGENPLQLDGFYRTLGEHWRDSALHTETAGARILAFSSHPRAEQLLGLTDHALHTRRFKLRAGDIPAVLLRYDLGGPEADTAPSRSSTRE